MPWYKVQVDDKVYIGEYRSLDNAVFGALRQDKNWLLESCMIGAEKIADRKPYNISKAVFTKELRKKYIK